MADDTDLSVKRRSIDSQIMDATADIPARTAEFNRKTEQGLAQLRSVSRETTSKVEGLESAIKGYSPPTLKEVPPLQIPKTDPLNVWSMAAMLVAGLGSLKTRQPLKTAMDAAAAGIQAFHKGDMEQANQAFQTWKAANDNAQATFRAQMDAYKTILSSVERREGLAIQEGNMKERTAAAEIQAAAHAFQNITLAEIARTHGIEGTRKYLDDQQKLMDKATKQGPAIERMKIQNEETHKLINSPEFQTMDPHEKLRRLAEIQGEGTPAHEAHQKVVEAKQKAADLKKQQADEKLSSVQSSIDQALRLSESGGVSSATGFIQKGYESVAGLVGADVYAKAHLYESYIQAIRVGMNSPQFVGRSNPEFRQAIEALAPLIKLGVPQKAQEDALKVLYNTINQLNGKPIKYNDPGLYSKVPVPREIPKYQDDDGGSAKPAKELPQVESTSGVEVYGKRNGAGSSHDNPLPVDAEMYKKVPSGTWVMDAKGNIGQKP
jgi:hypothetical protein